MDLFGLGIQIDYQDNASQGLMNTTRIFDEAYNSAQRTAQGLESKLTQLSVVSQGVGQVGDRISNLGSGIMGSLKGASDEATSFQSELNQLKFVTGATGDEFEKLRRVAIQTGIDTAFSPQEATKAMYQLGSAGLSTNDMLKSLNATLDLVAVSSGEISLDQGASLMASTLQKFNLDARDSVRVVNQLAQAANVSNFSFQDLSAFMNSIQSAPSTLHRPLEEFLAVGGMLRNIGQGAAQAGATVNGFGRQLVTLTRQLDNKAKLQGRSAVGIKFDAMAQMGLDKNTIWDSTGALKPLNEILTSIITQMANMSDEKRAVISQTLFGDQAKNLIFAVDNATKSMLSYDKATGKYVQTTKDGKMDVNQMTEAIRNSGGVAEQGAKDILSSMWGINKLFEGSKQTFQILLGQTILPIVGKLIQTVTKLLNVAISFLDKHPLFAKVLGVGTGIAGLSLLAVGGLLKLVSTFGLAIAGAGMFAMSLGNFGMSFLGATTVMGGFRSVLSLVASSLGGVLLTLAKGALVVGAMYLAWQTNFLGIRTLVTGFVNGIRTSFSEASRIASEGTDAFMQDISKLANSDSFFDKVTLTIVKFKMLWIGLCDAWRDNKLSDDNFKRLNELGLMPLLKTIIDIKQRFEAFAKGFAQGWQQASDNVVGAVKKILEWVDKVGAIFKPVENSVTKVNENIGKVDFSNWTTFGEVMGHVVAILGGLVVLTKIGSTLMTVGRMALTIGSGILSVVRLIGSGLSLLAGIVPTILGVIGTAVASILGFFGIVVTLPAWLVGLITVAVVALVVLVVTHFQQIKDFIMNVFSSIGEFFSGIGSSIASAVSGIVSSVASAVSGFFSTVWNGIVSALSTVGSFLMSAFTPVINFFQGLAMIISGVFQIIYSVVVGGLQILISLIQGLLQGAVQFIMFLFSPLVSFFQQVWSQIYNVALNVWNGITSVVSSVWNAITSVVSTAWNNIVGHAQIAYGRIVAIWSAIKAFFSQVWNAVYTGVVVPVWNAITNIVNNAYTRVRAIWQGITSFFSALFNAIRSVASAVWNGIASVISNVASRVRAVWSAISAFFSSLFNRIRSIASSAWSGIASIASSVAGRVRSAWSGVTGFFTGLFNTIRSSASSVFEWLAGKFEWVANTAQKVSDAWNSIKGGVSAGIDKVKAGAKKMVGLSTGGYVKTTGIAMLHPNEVVVNAPLTKRLDEFLLMNQRMMAMPPKPIVSPVAPQEGTEPSTVNFTPSNQQPVTPKPTAYANFFSVAPSNARGSSSNSANTYHNDNSVKFEEGAIQINLASGDTQDAKNLAERIMEEIKRRQDLDRIRNYNPIY